MIYKILKKIFALIFTIIFLPMWIIWFMLDIMLGNERLKEVMCDMWD